MNVYDFDGTIFPTDCSIGFFIWCMKRHPRLCFTFAPKVVKNLIKRKLGKMPEYLMQREFFCYLTLIDDFDDAYQMLISRGFKNYYGDQMVDTESSKSAIMISPSGFVINLIHHIKK